MSFEVKTTPHFEREAKILAKRYAVTEMSDICLHHFGTFHGRDLKGDQFISVVERGYHPGGNELEYDGIPGTSERTKRELFLSKEHCGNQCKGI